ncbi:MAG: hypothetical protein ABTQ29_08140 [Siculibacillus sp.]
MTREEIIAEIRRRIGCDLDWTSASDDELRRVLADLDAAAADPDGRFTDPLWAA